jgi:hypothetical protein
MRHHLHCQPRLLLLLLVQQGHCWRQPATPDVRVWLPVPPAALQQHRLLLQASPPELG